MELIKIFFERFCKVGLKANVVYMIEWIFFFKTKISKDWPLFGMRAFPIPEGATVVWRGVSQTGKPF